MSAVDVRQEERAARERERNLAKARSVAAAEAGRAWRAKVRQAASDTRKAYPRCKCDFRGVRTRADLVAMGGGCTMPRHCCPRLAAVYKKTGVHPTKN